MTEWDSTCSLTCKTRAQLRDALDRSTDDHGEVCSLWHAARSRLTEATALLERCKLELPASSWTTGLLGDVTAHLSRAPAQPARRAVAYQSTSELMADVHREQPAAPAHWRVGTRVPEHIYDGAGRPLVTMPSAELAARVVAAVNVQPVAPTPEPRWPLCSRCQAPGLTLRSGLCGGCQPEPTAPTPDEPERCYPVCDRTPCPECGYRKPAAPQPSADARLTATELSMLKPEYRLEVEMRERLAAAEAHHEASKAYCEQVKVQRQRAESAEAQLAAVRKLLNDRDISPGRRIMQALALLTPAPDACVWTGGEDAARFAAAELARRSGT